MDYGLNGFSNIQNIESPFTELLSLLKRYESSSYGLPISPYDDEELKVINDHINNAMDVLLQGLQGVGYLIATTSLDMTIVNEGYQLSLFITSIANLIEALNHLRLDADYILKERTDMNS